MRSSLRFVTFVLAVASALTLPAPPAGACSCRITTLAERVRIADAVFLGAAREVRTETVAPRGRPGSLALFQVRAVYKGSPEPLTAVRTARDAGACGAQFAEGVMYVVFALRDGGMLTTDVCLGTTEDRSVVTGLTPRHPYQATAEAPAGNPATRVLGARFPAPRASRSRPIAIAGALLVGVAGAHAARRRLPRHRD